MLCGGGGGEGSGNLKYDSCNFVLLTSPPKSPANFSGALPPLVDFVARTTNWFSFFFLFP